MAKSPKNAAVAASNALTLAMIVSATQSEQGFLFASKDAVAPFVADKLAEQNEGMPNPANGDEFATRATAEGINKIMTSNTPAAIIPATTPNKPSFAIETIDAPTNKRRGGGGQGIYPFDDMPAPATDDAGRPQVAAFFVPATADKPKPWESLQSAVSAATRRYATKTGEKAYTKADGLQGTRAVYDYTRKFKLSEGERQGVKGAWVSRTQ